MRPANRLCARLGKPEVLHLPGLNQFLHRTRNIFYRHVRVNPMLIQQIDSIHLQPLQRPFDGLLDVLGATIHFWRSRPMIVARTIAATQIEPELGGNHHPVANRRERFTHECFIGERPIHLSRIEERDAPIDGGAQKRNHLLFIFRLSVREAHAHAAES